MHRAGRTAQCHVRCQMPSLFRCGLDIRRSLDIACSISQNIQTKAAPRATTTIKNINVNAGAVSMFNIPRCDADDVSATISKAAPA
jgi:hypothetical protein